MPSEQLQRFARLVLVDADGTVLGAMPPVPVATPWWQDIEPVVTAALEIHGVEITVLRLLHAEFPEPPGGIVTYLAEARDLVAAEPWHGVLSDHPLRLPYAKPGGPKTEMDWALSELARLGIALTGKPTQVRSWNLSSVWRIPAEGQTVWLKSVPPFFAHEGRIIAALGAQNTPRLLAGAGGKSLLAEIKGVDLHEPAPAQRLEMLTMFVGLQADWDLRTDALLAMGLPDFRGPALTLAIKDVLARTAPELTPEACQRLEDFAQSLPRRFAALAACGIPDTLVHGDFHPGNFRGQGNALTLLDWGDSGVGHPLLDQPAFLERAPDSEKEDVKNHWNNQCLSAWPGSNPARAAELLAPVAAARQAVIYRRFLDNIEPDEQIYHRADPARWLRRTADILQGSEATI